MGISDKFYGVIPAVVTCLNQDDKIDLKGTEKLVNFLIDKGITGIFSLGTTGEMLKLTLEERKKIAETVIRSAEKRVPVMIQVGAMCTKDTIELAKHAYEAGADGIGVLTPSYFKVNDREMEDYYLDVAGCVPEDFPVYLYNIPQLSGNDLKIHGVKRILKNCKNIAGIKYSYPDLERVVEYVSITDEFSVLLGADTLLCAGLELGCRGTVSGMASVCPEPFVEIYKAFNEGNIEKMEEFQRIVNRYSGVLKSSVAYFKEALMYRGLNLWRVRKPNVDLDIEEAEALHRELEILDGEYEELLKKYS